NNKNVFNAILNEDQTDDIELDNFQDCTNFEKKVKMALYNAINYYWQVLSKEEILAILLDSQCKMLNFVSESLKAKTYNSLHKVYKQYQNQPNIQPIKQLL
ncbi:10914_t:CDS:1, partial [Racocetra fulgida]